MDIIYIVARGSAVVKSVHFIYVLNGLPLPFKSIQKHDCLAMQAIVERHLIRSDLAQWHRLQKDYQAIARLWIYSSCYTNESTSEINWGIETL